jgi:trigger factor
MGLDPRSIFTAEMVPKLRENARPEAVQRLQQILIVKKIAESESIEPQASEIRDRVNTIKARFANESLDLDKLEAIVTEEIIAEKTMAVLREKVTVELVPPGTLTPPEEDEEDDNTIEAEVVEASEAEVVETPSGA